VIGTATFFASLMAKASRISFEVLQWLYGQRKSLTIGVIMLLVGGGLGLSVSPGRHALWAQLDPLFTKIASFSSTAFARPWRGPAKAMIPSPSPTPNPNQITLTESAPETSPPAEQSKEQSSTTSGESRTASQPVAPEAASVSTVSNQNQTEQQQTARKPKIVYAPHPAYPPGPDKMHVTGSGRFKITFDEGGNAKSVEVLQSTGNRVLDGSTITTLKRWRAAPGSPGGAIVPIDYRQKLQARPKPKVAISRSKQYPNYNYPNNNTVPLPPTNGPLPPPQPAWSR
jgi:TonB family protein